MKIGIYAICKNEEANVDEWMAAVQEADSVTVVDTGSTDNTIAHFELLQEFRVPVHQIAVSPWRFDVARNAALALVPGGMDIAFPLDLDERLPPGWRAMIEAKWQKGTTKAFYTVQMWDSAGTKYPAFLQSDMTSRFGYIWRYPCHEGLYPDRIHERHVEIPELIVKTRHEPKDRSSYLGMLELGLAENPNDRRMTHYLARELFYRGRCAEAIPLFHRYLGLQGPPHPVEMTENLRLLARAEEALKK